MGNYCPQGQSDSYEVVGVKRLISPLLVAGDLGKEIGELTGAVATHGTTSTPTRNGRGSPTERPYLARIRDGPPGRARAKRQSPTQGQTPNWPPVSHSDSDSDSGSVPNSGADSELTPQDQTATLNRRPSVRPIPSLSDSAHLQDQTPTHLTPRIRLRRPDRACSRPAVLSSDWPSGQGPN